MTVKAAETTQDMSLLTISETISAVSGRCLCSKEAADNFSFLDVVIDSRNANNGSLFVPLAGESQDGHDFIRAALKNGASVVFVSQKNYERTDSLIMELQREYPLAVFIVVKDTLVALQSLAAEYVKKFPLLTKIGVTGSSGKTTTKELIAAVLSKRFSVVMNEGNFNSETGLPLSVFRIREQHQVGVFEMGMNRKNEIQELADVLNPDLAVVTNIGCAHVGRLGSVDAIAQEKKCIFSNFSNDSVAFVPEDDKYSSFLVDGIYGKTVFFGKNLVAQIKDAGIQGTDFVLDELKIHFSLPGYGNFLDAMAAVAVAKELGCSSAEIKEGLESVKPLFGRTQIIKGKAATVIQDCYNANPDSMMQALNFLDSIEADGQKVAILGDMLELGHESSAAHVGIIGKALDSSINFVVCVGEQMCKAVDSVESSGKKEADVLCFSDISDAGMKLVCDFLKDKIRPNDVVLLKGSRGIQLERLVPVLAGDVA